MLVYVCVFGWEGGGWGGREREREKVSCTLRVCIYVWVGELNRESVYIALKHPSMRERVPFWPSHGG